MIECLLNTLGKDALAELMHAFNGELEYFFDLPENHFLAVHVSRPEVYNILENKGYWYYGQYKGN